MRTTFVIAGLTLVSVVWVAAQEPGRARNPTPSGQTGRANTEASQAQIGNSNADNSGRFVQRHEPTRLRSNAAVNSGRVTNGPASFAPGEAARTTG